MADEQQAQSQQQPEAQGFTPITSQEQLNAVIQRRIERAEAKAAERFADYDELKAKAERFDEAQEAGKTELQRALDKAAKAEARLKALERDRQVAQWRAQVAKETGVPSDALRGDTLDDIRAQAEAIAPLIQAAGRPVVAGDGSHAAPMAASGSDWLRDQYRRSLRK